MSGMRLRALAAGMLGIALLLAGVLWDASRRRDAAAPAGALRAELARATGLADLALSSNARWMRHPSQVEPAAAIADAPGALDADPAGAWIAPPRAVVAEGARWRLERR